MELVLRILNSDSPAFSDDLRGPEPIPSAESLQNFAGNPSEAEENFGKKRSCENLAQNATVPKMGPPFKECESHFWASPKMAATPPLIVGVPRDASQGFGSPHAPARPEHGSREKCEQLWEI